MCCGENSARGKLWSAWWVVNAIGLIYAALNFFTMIKVWSAYKSSSESKADAFTMLTCMLFCVFLVVVFAILSFFLLVSKSMGRSKAGFVYGFLTSSAGNLALVLLLCSLAMAGFNDEIKNKYEKDESMNWAASTTKLFVSSYWFGFIAALGYVAYFVIMLISASAVDDPSVEERVQASEGLL